LGPKATRLLRLSQDDIEKGSTSEPVECTFPAPKAKKGKKKAETEQEDDDHDDGTKAKKKTTTAKKSKATSRKKSKKSIDEEKDIPSDSGSGGEDSLGLDSDSQHEFEGIESSSEVEGVWEIG
jgi:hypothetical protein